MKGASNLCCITKGHLVELMCTFNKRIQRPFMGVIVPYVGRGRFVVRTRDPLVRIQWEVGQGQSSRSSRNAKKLVLFVTSLVYGIPVRRDIRKCRQPKGLLHSNSRLRTLTLHRITVTRIENAVTSTAAKSRLTDTQNLRQRNSRWNPTSGKRQISEIRRPWRSSDCPRKLVICILNVHYRW